MHSIHFYHITIYTYIYVKVNNYFNTSLAKCTHVGTAHTLAQVEYVILVFLLQWLFDMQLNKDTHTGQKQGVSIQVYSTVLSKL